MHRIIISSSAFIVLALFATSAEALSYIVPPRVGIPAYHNSYYGSSYSNGSQCLYYSERSGCMIEQTVNRNYGRSRYSSYSPYSGYGYDPYMYYQNSLSNYYGSYWNDYYYGDDDDEGNDPCYYDYYRYYNDDDDDSNDPCEDDDDDNDDEDDDN